MYRRDIDGLRALAVVPVVAFHFLILPTTLTGGFVGVDIFFVISGYLITRTIVDDVGHGTYSVVDFYNRRIRRIFPAQFTVFFFCIVVAFFSSLPSEATQIGRSILSSIFFVSNYLFYSQTGYFDRNSETNPLLHTWSLSVEEQFYVVFPAMIYFMRKLRSETQVRLLFAIALASFLTSVWMVFKNSPAAFFLVQYRAWELLIGSLLAVKAIPALPRQWQAELVGIIGLLLIAASVFLISKDTPFPGLTALPPCLGAAAMIYAGEAHMTLVGRALALTPFRFTGLISYSLYLWHWPLIVFYRLLVVNEPGRTEKFALLAVCVTAATVSWKFIEQPFRKKPHHIKPAGTLIRGAAAMGVTAATVLALPFLIEKVFKYPSRAMEVLSYAKIDQSHMRVGTCFSLASDIAQIIDSNCLQTKPNMANFLIVGDSHAAHLWSGLQTTYPTVNFLQATGAGCTPIIDRKSGNVACDKLIHYIFHQFLPRTRLDGIIISARWEASAEILSGLIATANYLRNYTSRVLVFGRIAEYDQALPRIMARAIATNKSESELAASRRAGPTKEIDDRFAAALEGTPIEYVSVYRAICNPTCEIWATPEAPLQFDNDHLTCEGSSELARRVGPLIFPNLQPSKAQNHACVGNLDTSKPVITGTPDNPNKLE